MTNKFSFRIVESHFSCASTKGFNFQYFECGVFSHLDGIWCLISICSNLFSCVLPVF